MAAGCIPIAYDVPYGPADLITDGRDGRLIRSGDVPAMAEAITSLADASPEQIARMRASARRRANAFTEEAITALWARTLRRALVYKRATGLVRGILRRMRGAMRRLRRKD
jgi:poly(glycerol-phosphate) alpha-glucosyltransferase